jgi:hypothetical protein
MKHAQSASGVLLALSVLILGACATEEAGMKSSGSAQKTPTSSAESQAAVPSSLATLSDSLNACLSRIPKESSAGARMLAENSCRRDEAIRTGAARANDSASAGAQDDSLQRCLARIPKDASSGQKMLAEQSCKRDEAGRK